MLDKHGAKLSHKNRRSFKKNKSNAQSSLKMLGVNAAGLSNKLDSFNHLLETLTPSMFFVEESKMKQMGKIKTKSSQNYQIFELLRKKSKGGGLAIGVIHELNPVWVGEGDDEVEVLSIVIKIQDISIRCVIGYGPQESDSNERKSKFWERLEKEIITAQNDDMGLLIQMDGNLHAGERIIPGDPNPQNRNGKLFESFLNKFPHLSVANALSQCTGVITRCRKTVQRIEESVLDVFIICDKLLPYVKSLLIDEEKCYSLTNFNPRNKKQNKKIIESDHNTMIFELSLQFLKRKKPRTEFFNFRNSECQEIFFEMTTNTSKLSESFQNNLPFIKQAKKWKTNLNSVFQQSFKKIRVSTKKKQSDLTILFDKRTELKNKRRSASEEESVDIDVKIEQIEEKIAFHCAEANRKKVLENFGVLSGKDNAVNTNGMWALKKKVFPKNMKALPVCKKDQKGNIITEPSQLRSLYLETYKHRLRHRPIKDNLITLKQMKEKLWSLRLHLVRLRRSQPWGEKDLEGVLSKLKSGKARDPHGWVNELFKEGVMGQDLKASLLMLVNKVKNNVLFPEFMEWANITSLYKGKGDRLDLANDRGIFIVSIIRSIVMKLIYNDKYDKIDENMSDSNVGARKGKNIRNHIFVLNGIVHDALHNKKTKPINITLLDYRQCFDSMWLEEAMNDLFNAGFNDDKLAVVYEANRNNKVAISTPDGLTDRTLIPNIVMQGDVFGPIQCSVQVDTFGKECLDENKYLYPYKGLVGVPPLAMVDDILCVSECGLNSVILNSFIRAKTNIKKLQYGIEKCHKIHVGKKTVACPELYIDQWEVEEVNEIETGNSKNEDVLKEEAPMMESKNEKYLGDIVSSNGSNTKNIEARSNKGKGIVKQIMTILEDIYFGNFQFEIAVILRNSLLINGILTNSEAWYDIKISELETLEKVDEALLRQVLEAPSSTPKEMLYLEMGLLPIRFIILSRRLNFLHDILNESKESLISRFFAAQFANPVKNDWTDTVQGDLESLGLPKIEEVEKLNQNIYQKMVKTAVRKEAFKYLLRLKNGDNQTRGHSKVSHIKYGNFMMQDYLKPNYISIQDAKFLFLVRTRMLNIKANFKNGHADILCIACKQAEETQEHLLKCEVLLDEAALVASLPEYKHLFGEHLPEKVIVAEILKKNFKKRKAYK